MNPLKPLIGLLLLFTSVQAQSQADLNDFLSGQVVGNEIFMEYDYRAMLDSIDVLNGGTSSLNDFIKGQVVGNEIFMEYDYRAML
ncbi:MAG: hypothetical protein ACPG6J_05245, partial [Flavobacteriaceae bacterium]